MFATKNGGNQIITSKYVMWRHLQWLDMGRLHSEISFDSLNELQNWMLKQNLQQTTL
jgi:hypothetical protein